MARTIRSRYYERALSAATKAGCILAEDVAEEVTRRRGTPVHVVYNSDMQEIAAYPHGGKLVASNHMTDLLWLGGEEALKEAGVSVVRYVS